MISLYRRPKVAAISFAIVFFQTAATTHAETPPQGTKLPKTPCDPVGSYKQFPGVAPSGKNCGNGITTILAGPVTLNISSMQPERSGAGPVNLTNRGFGRGVTFGAWITFSAPSTYVLYDETGARTSFTTTSGAKYYPEDRARGNLSELTVEPAPVPMVTLKDPRTNAKTQFTKQARWDRYLPTSIFASDGIETTLTYQDNGVPAAIEDKRTNQKILFASENGLVNTITNADGVQTTLKYTDQGYLSSVTQADGKSTTLEYKKGMVTKLTNPDGTEQSNTYFDNGVLESSSTYSKSGGISFTAFTYTEDSVVSTSYVPGSDANGAKPLKFSRVVFKNNDVFGRLGSEVYAADGGYDDKSNKGVLLSSLKYGRSGELQASYDQYGLGTLYFYDSKGECRAAVDGVPELPLPTCIKTKDGTTTITYNDRYLPKTVSTTIGNYRKTVKTEYDSNGNPTSQTLVNAQGVQVGSVTTAYNDKYPSEIKTTSIQTASYDNLSRPVTTSSSDGSIASYTYGTDGRVSEVDVDGIKLKISARVAGAVDTTVEDGTMTTTVQTSADGLGYGVTTQRMAKDANQIARSSGTWGGVSGDQSARAAFDISRLKRMQDDATAPGQTSEASQLMASSTTEHFDDVTTIDPTRGITRETSHQIWGEGGAVLSEGSTQTQQWPRVEKAESRKKKRSPSSSLESRSRPEPRFLPGGIPGR